MSRKDEYVRKMQIKLEEWNVEIDKLAAKADGIKADVKVEYKEQMESLKAKQAVARKKIAELQKAGDSAWEDLKAGSERAWEALRQAVDSVKTRFK